MNDLKCSFLNVKFYKKCPILLDNLQIKLRRSLADCGNISVSKEVVDVMYNIPELFVDDNETDFSILF